MDFPDHIRTLRRQLGFTQAELAAILECTTQSVSNWECGRCEPWPITQAVILAHLQVLGGEPSTLIDRI